MLPGVLTLGCEMFGYQDPPSFLIFFFFFFLPLLTYKAGFPRRLSSKIIHLQIQETWFRPLCWEDPWRRKWQSTSVFLSGKFYGWRSLKGYSPKGCQESDGLSTQTSIKYILGLCILYYYLYSSLLLPGFSSLLAWVQALRALSERDFCRVNFLSSCVSENILPSLSHLSDSQLE